MDGQVSAQVPEWLVGYHARTSPGAAGARHCCDLCPLAFRSVKAPGTPIPLCHPVSETVHLAFQLGGGGITLWGASSAVVPAALVPLPVTDRLCWSPLPLRGHPRDRRNYPSVPRSPNPPPSPSCPAERPDIHKEGCGQSAPNVVHWPSPARICLLGTWLSFGLRVLPDPAVCFGLLIMHVLSLVGGAS